MFDKLSTMKVKPALSVQHQHLMGVAEAILSDRAAIRPLPGSEIRIRDTTWERHYDALGG
ncbi:hypothetical protein GL279_17940 [Paracoccus limosus]|uniref:Uncharacterized protein n=1 Tax=Paracoccus limosus TaxID=913252 RepID=A0A844H6S3_9RHOB|nr:hypothetical protein [Paracoccus limosus]MTH36472.1 hypothetical protein [Paracoccus limosus]